MNRKKGISISLCLIIVGALLLYFKIDFLKGAIEICVIGIIMLALTFLPNINSKISMLFFVSALFLTSTSLYLIFLKMGLISEKSILVFLSVPLTIIYMFNQALRQNDLSWILYSGIFLLIIGLCMLLAVDMFAIFFIISGIYLLLRLK